MQAPDRVFLKRAAECERMAELTRDPESKFTWRRMADRWHRCAKVAVSANSAAASDPELRTAPKPGVGACEGSGDAGEHDRD
jgi:hypothetical protein